MSTFESAKKSQTQSDWHRADIVAALHKQGWSLRRLSIHHGYKSAGSLKNALDRPWPKGQKIIAEAIGLPPEAIWPTRYDKRFSGEWN
ncbi:transcriptional regulator [Pantoea stewartii]|jgi:Ner family transcriptional regulator|uniref:helix-turn-helix domain-containing protein n=1 Tax=Pantoea TaxID=53335 RepID=UPI003366EF47